MSIIYVGPASGRVAETTLRVVRTPDGHGNLHGGLFQFSFTPQTMLIGEEGTLTVVLDDQTGLELHIVDFMTTAPANIPHAENLGSLLRLFFAQMLRRQLVLFSIILQDPGGELTLCCDPQVGNDPKV